MRDRWRELLEALAEELFRPAGGRPGGAGTAEEGGGAGLLPPAFPRTASEQRRGTEEGELPERPAGLLAALAEQTSAGRAGEAFPPDGLGEGRTGLLWPAGAEDRSGGGKGAGLPAEGRTAPPAGRLWSGPAGGGAPRRFPDLAEERLPQEERAPAAGPRGKAAAVTAEELDRAFQRDARRYDGDFSLY